MKILRQIIVLFSVSIVIGIVFNQFLPRGIPWYRLVRGSFSFQSSDTVPVEIISADSALVLLQEQKGQFIDLRVRDDYQLDHIPSSLNLPPDIVLSGKADQILPDSGRVILYDQEGDLETLRRAAGRLSSTRFQTIYLIFGGYLNWLEKGYPVKKGEKP